ncbi:MAG: S8 family serine peptidase [Candidatus Acidiferrales bacterium]
MKRCLWILVALIALLGANVAPAGAQILSLGSNTTTAPPTRVVVRDNLGLSGIKATCLVLNCTVVRGLGDPSGQLFLITTPSLLDPVTYLLKLRLQLGVVDAEIDQVIHTSGASAGPAPSYLTDKVPVTYYGATVWRGYVTQTGNQLIQTDPTHSRFNVAGSGVTVAVIDTGVDPTHPVLQNLLVSGYDFTRNVNGGSEKADVSQSTDTDEERDQANPAQVNQSTVAVLDQSTVAVLDSSQYAAFGHGTMVAGIVHLVAPQAKIMPLKSFQADGSGYNSDILRAIYYAAKNGAKVINMSFSYSTSSQELENAVNYAARQGVILVASAGNDGKQVSVYPGALKNVIDVASTTNADTVSKFSNYGAPPVWLAAPGEAVVTTYPWGTYAAGWGTSFSAPFASGAAALLVNVSQKCNQSSAFNALAHAQWISAPQVGNRRLDTYQAVQAWRSALGLD